MINTFKSFFINRLTNEGVAFISADEKPLKGYEAMSFENIMKESDARLKTYKGKGK